MPHANSKDRVLYMNLAFCPLPRDCAAAPKIAPVRADSSKCGAHVHGRTATRPPEPEPGWRLAVELRFDLPPQPQWADEPAQPLPVERPAGLRITARRAALLPPGPLCVCVLCVCACPRKQAEIKAQQSISNHTRSEIRVSLLTYHME